MERGRLQGSLPLLEVDDVEISSDLSLNLQATRTPSNQGKLKVLCYVLNKLIKLTHTQGGLLESEGDYLTTYTPTTTGPIESDVHRTPPT